MKALGILLLSLLIVSDVKADYSINDFINHLQETGYYSILIQIKYFYGTDIAISFCETFIQSKDCEIVVKIYIPASARSIHETDSSETFESIIFYPDNNEIYKGKEAIYHDWIVQMKNQYNIEY